MITIPEIEPCPCKTCIVLVMCKNGCVLIAHDNQPLVNLSYLYEKCPPFKKWYNKYGHSRILYEIFVEGIYG